MYDIISVSSGNSYVMDAKMQKFIMNGKFEGGFMVNLQYKDLGLAMNTGREDMVPLPMTSTAVQVFEAARAEGFGKEDISSVIKVWEKLAGIEVRK
jgi:2-hydroxymethylglutarate dehydrogenase